MDILDEMREGAVESLRRCATPIGLKASGGRLGHNQVWARDSMIALLGARFCADDIVGRALHASIATLRSRQAAAGAIPNNVDVDSNRANFRAYADAGLWWIVGSAHIAPDLATTRAVLRWCQCQDVDQSGLLSMQEGADWQDLFCTRGKGLYVNCLYVLALRAASRLASGDESREYLERADLVRQKINEFFWYAGDGDMLRHISHTFSTESKQQRDALGRKRWLPEKKFLVGEQYYLPYLGFRAAGEWFDSLGNLLAILADVAGMERAARLLQFIERAEMHRWPLASLYPAIQPGDPDWRDYYGMLNGPHQYHNGGIWPFIGGFYVAALVKAGRPKCARAALHFELVLAAGHQPAFVGLAIVRIVDAAGPGVGVVLLHRENANSENFAGAQGGIGILAVDRRLTGLRVDRIAQPSDRAAHRLTALRHTDVGIALLRQPGADQFLGADGRGDEDKYRGGNACRSARRMLRHGISMGSGERIAASFLPANGGRSTAAAAVG